MTVTITKGMIEKEIAELLNQFPNSNFIDNIDKRPIDMTKYFGKI